MSDSNYSTLDKILHKLALNYPALAEIFFDVDQHMVKQDPELIRDEKHVFVSGLARAGTTVLMRRFYSTGQFRSLTYRDMPFVLAPNLWKKISSLSHKDFEAVERAHGDGLKVDLDSPESLDEVFWRVFSKDNYLKKDTLIPYKPKKSVLENYLRYVNGILNSSDNKTNRYLSKNNNNVLRLDGLTTIFPQALILIPFRNPLQHANSLMRQHIHFCKDQKDDPFTLSYMTWLSHHEFGLDHRPFTFPDAKPNTYSPDSLNYWLSIWLNTYHWLLQNHSSQAHFVCYEKLCENPECWTALAELAAIPAELESSDILKLSTREIPTDNLDPTLLQLSQDLYQQLQQCSV